MIIDKPRNIAPLGQLWQQAFGDTEAFIEVFFRTGFSPERCRCLYQGNDLAAMLYWFDCTWAGKRLAYLYAVATDKAYRGQGFCRALMENTHAHLRALGYQGAILVPNSGHLFGLYEKLGYRTCGYVSEFTAAAGTPIALREIRAEEYTTLRRQYLPENGVVQEGAALALLEGYARFYAGKGLLLAAYSEEGKLTVCELLGDPAAAPGILAALGYPEGKFRTTGKDKPFAMYYPLTEDDAAPGYLGLALD